MSLKRNMIKLYEEIYGLPLVIKAFFTKMMHPKETILLKGFYIYKRWKLANFNWGDDLNYYLFKDITKKRIALLPGTKLSESIQYENYLCIGSTIMSFDLTNTVVWGSGLLNDKMGFKLKSKPRKIVSVRGPLTRQWLLAQGIDCPEMYGDPALILPYFYEPKIENHYRLGIIPHYKDIDNSIVKYFENMESIKIINISGYDDWHEFIDQINECDYILSSSLHGVIVSEAYKIPVLWVKFSGSDYVDGWDFKFNDFYGSLNKKISPFMVNETTGIENIERQIEKWKPSDIDYESIINCCPFPLIKKEHYAL